MSAATPASAAPASSTSTASAVKTCTMLAVQAEGAAVTTIEGLATDGTLHPMQEAFRDNHGLQCGFCTPGMVMSALDLVKNNPNPSEERDPRLARGQPLPLHRLSQHRQGRYRPAPAAMTRVMRHEAAQHQRAASARPSSARKTSASSPAGAPTPTTSIAPARPTPTSCARRTRMRRSRKIDTAAARSAPGVVAVFTGADMADKSAACPAAGRSTTRTARR